MIHFWRCAAIPVRLELRAEIAAAYFQEFPELETNCEVALELLQAARELRHRETLVQTCWSLGQALEQLERPGEALAAYLRAVDPQRDARKGGNNEDAPLSKDCWRVK